MRGSSYESTEMSRIGERSLFVGKKKRIIDLIFSEAATGSESKRSKDPSILA